MTDPALVEWEVARVCLTPCGRLDRDEAGRPIRYASAVDEAVEPVRTALWLRERQTS